MIAWITKQSQYSLSRQLNGNDDDDDAGMTLMRQRLMTVNMAQEMYETVAQLALALYLRSLLAS